MSEEKKRPFKGAIAEAEKNANAERVDSGDFVFHKYPDYETYRDTQVKGNKAKLRMQFVKEGHIEKLAAFVNEHIPQTTFGLCHGTRRGLEQAWFSAHLTGEPHVIGTEISDTADQFPNTVQWDFHDENPEWVGKADFVYSNSWDHAMDIEKAFGTWIKSLKVGGFLILDHTKGQSPEATNALDPVGMTYAYLKTFLMEKFGATCEIFEEINLKRNKEYRARVLILRRNA